MFSLGILVHAAWALSIRSPVDWDAQYYRLVAERWLAGEGATTGSLWNLAYEPEALPVPADLHWMPLPSRVLIPGLWLWPAHGDQVVAVLVAAAWAPVAYLLARAAGATAGWATLAGALAATGGVWARCLSTSDVYGLYGLVGALAFLALQRRSVPALVGLSVAAALTRTDGLLLGLALGFGLWTTRGPRAAGAVALSGLLAHGLWVARSVAVGGGAVLSARRSAATASDYASFFEGTVEPITLARRLELSVRAGPAVLEAWLAPSALLLTPFVVWAAWKKRRESWVRAAVAYGLVGPPVVVLLAPVLATHGTLERTSPALLVPTVALGVLGLASANRWLVRVRSFPRWVLPGSIGAAWAFLSFALGTDHLARQPVVAIDCAALRAAAGDGPLFSAHPLRVEQRCGVPGVLLTGRLPPERAAELADRYDVRAAYLPAATDVGSLTPENAAQVLIGWTPDGDIWRGQNLKPMATSPM